MPTLSIFFGIVIRMYFDDHPPPHFHAIYGEYEVDDYRLKAGRILLRLNVALRLKPPEGARLQSRLKACWAL